MKKHFPPDQLWDIARLAEFLGVTRRTVYTLTADRRITFLKIGRELRFRPSDVEEYLERVAVRPPEVRAAATPRRGRPRSVDRRAA